MIDIDKGFKVSEKKTVKTDRGTFTIRKCDNQMQGFIQKTVNMTLEEVVSFAANTSSFKPLIKAHKYCASSTKYFIVEPSEESLTGINQEKECLWELI